MNKKQEDEVKGSVSGDEMSAVFGGEIQNTRGDKGVISWVEKKKQ